MFHAVELVGAGVVIGIVISAIIAGVIISVHDHFVKRIEDKLQTYHVAVRKDISTMQSSATDAIQKGMKQLSDIVVPMKQEWEKAKALGNNVLKGAEALPQKAGTTVFKAADEAVKEVDKLVDGAAAAVDKCAAAIDKEAKKLTPELEEALKKKGL